MYSIIIDNFSWMLFNILLAIIPVLLARLFYMAESFIPKVIFFLIWLFFVPNTIYIFTDILHFIIQINGKDLFGTVILAVQYAILFVAGFLTFLWSLYPIELKLKRKFPAEIIAINFLIGFGVLLGRVYRLNSWDIIFGIGNVVNVLFQIITSPKIILLGVLFGLFANFMYFLFRKKFDKMFGLRLN